MPAKGSIAKRTHPQSLTKEKYFKAFAKQTGRKDVKQFRRIAAALFTQMGQWIKEDVEGFKLPFNMGILMVVRFTPKRKAVDIRKSMQFGKRMYFQNLHSFGDAINITWIKPEYVKYRNMNCYFFKVHRTLGRDISRSCIAGKIYKKVESREQYAREMITLDNIQERYDEKIHKRIM
jgi:hypothetical protein